MMNTELKGRRIQLLRTNDPYTKLVTGSKGTIAYTRHDGFSNTIAVNWDDGSTLTLVEGDDLWLLL